MFVQYVKAALLPPTGHVEAGLNGARQVPQRSAWLIVRSVMFLLFAIVAIPIGVICLAMSVIVATVSRRRRR